MTFLETAERLGARLCRDAIWHQGRCTWLSDLLRGDDRIVHGPIGPDLYTGSAGIAYFLRELASVTGEPVFARTAAGALQQTLAILSRVPPTSRQGFYCGWAGIAWVLAQAGRREEALSLVHELPPSPAGEADLVSGTAGLVAALCSLARITTERALLDLAWQHGDALLKQARVTEAGHSWHSLQPKKPQPHLTGFSHGAAGIGWALLELGTATGEARFVHAAEEAFRYERTHFSAAQGNWPDYRFKPTGFMRVWCHGAGGIAFSRLRAWQLLGDPRYREEAEIGLAAVEPVVAKPNFADFSLCHGVAGNAALLLYAETILGRSASAAIQAAQAGVAHYEEQRLPWAGGRAGRETPGFMLGLAGIGSFYLQLAERGRHPSALLPL